jgi:hypothetical protein
MKRTGLFVLTLLFAMTLLIIPTPAPVAAQLSGKILFSSDRFGSEDIFVMNADGSGQTPLTFSPGKDTDAVWSPDGSRIAFTSNRDGNDEIYVMSADGSNLTRLTYNDVRDYQPTWSPDGRIAFSSRRDDNYEIYVMNADGSNQTRLTYSEGHDVNPDWSPDGAWIAYLSSGTIAGSIYVMSADGSNNRELVTGDTVGQPNVPRWSPDGSQIAFQRGSTGMFPNAQIYIVNADGTNERTVLIAGYEDVYLYSPVWSPDGRLLAFNVGHEELGSEVGIMTLDGQTFDLISQNEGNDYVSDWIGVATPAQPAPEPPSANARCFEETGYCIDGRIREYWEQNGGLPVFGLPIGPQQSMNIEGKTVQAQWFERNRLELHPENAPPYDVLLGRLGADRLAQQGYDWQAMPGETPQEGCRFFEETGRNVCGDILAAWRANGLELDGQRGFNANENLALFGLPLTGLGTETTADGRELQVQYFERARFELHPENEPPFHVQLGLLGSEVRGAR